MRVGAWVVAASALGLGLGLGPAGEARGAKINGRVVDREGKPAGGAVVWLARLGFLETAQVVEATADADGRFAAEAGPGQWGVFARRGDEGGQAAWGDLPSIDEKGKDPAPVTVRLRAPSRLHGRLLDAETGKPVAGGRFALDDARRVEVDAQGRFEAPGLAAGNHEAYPLCPGYERRRILFDTTGKPDAELELRLPRAGKVVGRVVDAAGKPIQGATVGLRTSGSIFSGSALWEKCDDDGHFSYDGRALGRTGRLSARAEGYKDEERDDVLVNDPAAPATINFTLTPDPTLGKKAAQAPPGAAPAAGRRDVTGRVLGPDGKPRAGVVVRWGLRTSSDRIPEASTDDSGAFKLPGVPDEDNVLSVMAKGLAPAFPRVEAGGDRRVEVALKTGRALRGRVVEDDGTPIEGARVVPQVPNPRPNWAGHVYLDELVATTGADGEFSLDGVPEGSTCDVVSENHSALRQKTLSNTETENVFTLLGDGAIRGRVVDPAGNPVRNFRVQVKMPKGAKAGDPVGGYFAGYEGTGLSFTSADGTFAVTRLTSGNLHRLVVIAEGLGVGEADRVAAKPFARWKGGDAVTVELQAPNALRVLAYTAGGKTVPGARVTVVQSENRGGFVWGQSESSWDDTVTARTGADGWAEFRALPFSQGVVAVRANGYARVKLDWTPEQDELKVFLDPEAKLTGTVRDAAGKAPAAARVILSWGQGEMLMTSTDARDGRFTVDALRPGTYQLSVGSPAGGVQQNETVTLEAGATVTKDVRLPAAPAGRR